MTADSRLPIKAYPGRDCPAIFKDGCVLTIGAFDGLHSGHQRIIEQLKSKAHQQGLPSAVMTFRPDPGEFFTHDPAPALMSWRERMLAIKALGVDAVVCMPFDKKVSRMSAEDFIAELVNQLRVRFLLIGDDFRFGAGRTGDFSLLQRKGAELGFEVARSETHSLDDQRISSTLIRQCLSQGDLSKAEALLGRPYQVCSRVIKGKQLGRQLGFATANLPMKRRKVAMTGVFAVRVALTDGTTQLGVANLGTRPAVNSLEQPLLEVHLLDWQGDLYGQEMTVSFCKKLRDETNFETLEKLKLAIQQDVENARQWFANNY